MLVTTGKLHQQTRITIAFSNNILCILKHKWKLLVATTLPHTKQLPATKEASFYVKSIMKVAVCTLQSCAYIVVSLIVCKYVYVRQQTYDCLYDTKNDQLHYQ